MILPTRAPFWLLDCDNTLYSGQSGLFDRVNERIVSYMVEVLAIDPARVQALRDGYRRDYGMTLGGLMRHHGAAPDDYLDYVHEIEIADIIAPDPALGEKIAALPGEKAIFTNGSRDHAARILAHLGIGDVVGPIFDIVAMDYVPKPLAHGYRKVLDHMGAAPAETVFADDMVVNLDTGRAMGMTTVLVGPTPHPEHGYAPTAHALFDAVLEGLKKAVGED